MRDKTDLSKLRVFGSKAWVITMPRGDKLDQRPKEMRMIGYASNGYRLWGPKTNKILVLRDVRFDEKDYVFEKKMKQQNNQCKFRLTVKEEDETEEREEKNQTTNIQEEQIKCQREQKSNSQEIQETTERPRKEPIEDYYIAEDEMYNANISFCLLAEANPGTYKEAVSKGEDWKKAINDKIQSLEELSTWIEQLLSTYLTLLNQLT